MPLGSLLRVNIAKNFVCLLAVTYPGCSRKPRQADLENLNS